MVVTKSGKMTYGLERFFVPVWADGAGPVFSEFTLLSVKRRTSYPVMTEQVWKTLRCVGASAAPDEGQWPTTAARAQEPQSSRGSTEPVASFHPRAYQVADFSVPLFQQV